MTKIPDFVVLYHSHDETLSTKPPKGCTIDEKRKTWTFEGQTRKFGETRFRNYQAGLVGVFSLTSFEDLKRLASAIKYEELQQTMRYSDSAD